MLRAYRSTQPRLGYASAVVLGDVQTVRRNSAAFKDIPGGQILGPSLDYSHRVLALDVLDGEPAAASNALEDDAVDDASVARPPLPTRPQPEGAAIPDVTREPLLFPATRAARLQSLSRADTGGVLALGYANMRGYGSVHPTINEVRLGYADVMLTHPISGEPFCAGRVRVSSAEIVTTLKRPDGPGMALGFCATIGWNEVKTIAGSMLDMAMDLPEPHPSHTEEYVFFAWRRAHACHIGHDVWLGHGVTVMPGVSIGTGAVVGSGAVVTKPIGDYEIAVGVPARVTRKRFSDDVITALLRIAWWDWDRATLAARFDVLRDVDAFIAAYG